MFFVSSEDEYRSNLLIDYVWPLILRERIDGCTDGLRRLHKVVRQWWFKRIVFGEKFLRKFGSRISTYFIPCCGACETPSAQMRERVCVRISLTIHSSAKIRERRTTNVARSLYATTKSARIHVRTHGLINLAPRMVQIQL